MFGQQIQWPDQKAPVTAMKTYAVAAPVATHFRPASCEEVGCLNYHNGWITKVPVDSDLEDIVKRSGRKWQYRSVRAGVAAYTFAPGTACFNASTHRVPLERPALFVVRDGDHRGNPTGRQMQHTRPEFWVEDFAEHQQGIKDARDKG